jgi:hypothetical protein
LGNDEGANWKGEDRKQRGQVKSFEMKDYFAGEIERTRERSDKVQYFGQCHSCMVLAVHGCISEGDLHSVTMKHKPS